MNAHEVIQAAEKIAVQFDDGFQLEDIPAIVEKAGSASSMKGNPVTLSDDELAGILRMALQDGGAEIAGRPMPPRFT